MAKRHTDSAHIQALKRELVEARQITHTGIAIIIFDFPEIADLLHVVSDLIYVAHPGKGATTDGDGRGAADTLSVDGLSTATGRSTLAARKRLDRWRKNVAHMVRNIENELDPNYKRPPSAQKPRCGSPNCPNPGNRQPHGTKFCMFCGRQFAKLAGESKKTKTRLTLVKHDES